MRSLVQYEPDGIRMTFEFGAEAGGSSRPPAPFELSVNGSVLSFSNCCIRRPPITLWWSDMTCSLSGSASVYVGLRYDTETGEGDIVFGASPTDASWSAESYDRSSGYDFVPLYLLSPSGDTWSIACDYRHIPVSSEWN